MQTLKMIRTGSVKIVIVASNCPNLRKSELEYYCMLAKADIYHYPGNNVELGTACGRFHRIAALAITNPGDSDILVASAQ